MSEDETYRNRDYQRTRASREMADKRMKLVKESKFAFLSAVIDHYCYLMDLLTEKNTIYLILPRIS